MTRLKHVLVLTILILPMFALVPSLVASPNNTLVSQEKVDTSLPAQFVEETLRVAVYAESNLTLPAYATGGVYTDNYQNVIDLLESAGYAVTALSTQDILDHKLMVADYDAFVLPNQLPRESITNHIKDYWLGGGGVLCFGASVGFLFYSGLIDPSEEGNFNLYPIDGSGLWTYAGLTGGSLYDGMYLNQRNPVTKSLEDATVYPYTGNETLLGGFDLVPQLGDRYLELAYQSGEPTYTSIAGFDNPDRGGRIVFISGNCSSFETWIEPVVVDSIDWLAPRPKARILFDLTHTPIYGVDAWDIDLVQSPVTQIDMRAFLVNRSYTFDKLYPSNILSSDTLEGYDILVVCDPLVNFTASEVAAVTNWVNDGGSILGIADHTLSKNQNMNYLLSNMDIGMNHSATGTNALVPADLHATHEGTATMSCLAPGAVGTAGSAFSIWEDAVGVPVIGGDQHGNGRVILIADGAIMRDVRIGIADNAQALINFANWLSAATAKVLLYNDEFMSTDMYGVAPVLALESLGIDFYLTNTESYLNLSLYEYWDQWDLVIIDQPGFISNEYLDNIQEWVESGGKLITSLYWAYSYDDHPIWPILGFMPNASIPDGPDVHIWENAHPVFNMPIDYNADLFRPTFDYGSEGSYLHVLPNGIPLAGLTNSPEENMSVIVLRDDGNVLTNAFLIDEFQGDYDNSTYMDSFELWVNEIGFIYYDRPMIDHPDDATYMETETGNEITWTPTADAGPWEYIFSVNGTPVQGGHWTGAPLTFNVDGVNASITEYELTVSDRLGYSVSDLVTLNVTEYVEPPGPGGPFDPTLLIIIGAAAGVVIILVVLMQLKKKK